MGVERGRQGEGGLLGEVAPAERAAELAEAVVGEADPCVQRRHVRQRDRRRQEAARAAAFVVAGHSELVEPDRDRVHDGRPAGAVADAQDHRPDVLDRGLAAHSDRGARRRAFGIGQREPLVERPAAAVALQLGPVQLREDHVDGVQVHTLAAHHHVRLPEAVRLGAVEGLVDGAVARHQREVLRVERVDRLLDLVVVLRLVVAEAEEDAHRVAAREAVAVNGRAQVRVLGQVKRAGRVGARQRSAAAVGEALGTEDERLLAGRPDATALRPGRVLDGPLGDGVDGGVLLVVDRLDEQHRVQAAARRGVVLGALLHEADLLGLEPLATDEFERRDPERRRAVVAGRPEADRLDAREVVLVDAADLGLVLGADRDPEQVPRLRLA